MNLKRDGHIHSPFCPHGSTDSMESYVKKAITLDLEEISFTEHAPLPGSFQDPAPTKDSSMKAEDVERYFEEGNRLKEKYKKEIKINIGFEIDFIEGYEEEISKFLDRWGNEIDDSILSVHMVQTEKGFICMDYGMEEFGKLVSRFGTVNKVHEIYYQLIEKSIFADLGKYKPNRIGHLTLANKFQRQYPVSEDFSPTILSLLKKIKEQDMELDANSAGWYKPDCLESYPPLDFIQEAQRLGITIVPGSDSHQSKDLARGFAKFK